MSIEVLLSLVPGRSDEFKLLYLRECAKVAYVQPSQWHAYWKGEVESITVRREKQFPFVLPIEIIP
jgi:hypothetical protein